VRATSSTTDVSRSTGASDHRPERRREEHAPEREEDEAGARLAEHRVDVGHDVRELQGGRAADRHDEDVVGRTADGRVERRAVLLLRCRDLLRDRHDEVRRGQRVVRPDDPARRVNTLREDVSAPGHRLPWIAERRTAAAIVAARALGLRRRGRGVEAPVDLGEQLLLKDDEHQYRGADHGDRDSTRGKERDAKSEAHALRIT
jgi:hypothetical protein